MGGVFCCPSENSRDGYDSFDLNDRCFVHQDSSGADIQGEFGRCYSLRQQLGKGSTASCYACIENATGNWYAVKIINKKKISVLYSDLLPQFRREVDILGKLSHPNIIRLKEVFENSARLHVVTELARGGELFEFLVSQPNSTLTEASVSFLLRQCISAVAHMHAHGVIHRDIKLENILLQNKPRGSDYKAITLKIIDFGLAKYLGTPQTGRRNTARTFFGTVGYIAPEMMKRQTYTKAVDVWALGVVSFVLLCGVFPFDDNEKKHYNSIDYRLRYPKWVAGLSDSAKDLMSNLLEINPKKRISAASALQHPWVSGQTASPRSMLASPNHLRQLLKSPVPTVDGGFMLDSASAATNNNMMILAEECEDDSIVSPLLLDHQAHDDMAKTSESSHSSSSIPSNSPQLV